jgi:ankyrin repeat protein
VDDQRRTILYLLAEHLEFVHWDTLLKAFVYLDCADSYFQTPLHVAVTNRNRV